MPHNRRRVRRAMRVKHNLQDLIDMEHFQNLQDRLNEIYSFPSAIIDNDGHVLTATGWQDVCTQFHRKNQDCLQECIKSDQYILSHLHEANPAVSYRCPHGLVDNAAPIIIDGIHYGNFFTGQFFLEKPDLEFFQGQARKYGFDEAAYLEAVKQVPIWSQQQLNSYLFFIKGLIAIISESGIKKLREIESNKQIKESSDLQRLILQTAMDGFWLADPQGRLLEVNEAYCRMSGYSAQELLEMRIPDLEVEETSTETAAHIHTIMTQGEDRFESRHRRKDGSTFDVEVSVQYRPAEGGRLIGFLRDITERKRADAVLAARSRILEHSLTHSLPDLLRNVLDECERLTESSIGFFHFVMDDQDTLSLQNWSTRTLRDFCQAEGQGLHYPMSQAGIWADSARQRQAIIVNDYPESPRRKGLPPGHAEVRRFMSVPILRGEKVAAVIGFGNKPTDYGESDVSVVAELADLCWDIAERKRAEAALQENEDKFYRAFANAPVLLSLSDLDTGRFSEVNNEGLRVTGFSREEVVGKTSIEIGWISPEDRARLLAILKEHGRVSGIELDLHAKGGREVRCLVNSEVVTIGGRPQLLMTSQDITERKRAEEALQRSQQVLRSTFASVRDAFFVLDAGTGLITECNRAACEMFGYEADELLGRTTEFLHINETALAEFRKQLFSAIENQGFFFLPEFAMKRKDGTVFPTEHGVTAIEVEGRRVGWASLVRDITERRQAEESHIRLATAVEQAAETIVITDSQATILYANPAFEKTTGYTRAEVLGQNPRMLKSGKQDTEFYRRMWETLARGEVWQGHFTNRRKDGTFFDEEATISPVRDSAGAVVNYVAVKRDVTREVQLEAQFRQAQKMEAIGQLAGGVAHDFNNILAATMMQISLLQLSPNLDEETLTALGLLEGQAKRAAALTRQLLMFSRRSVLEVRALDLNEVVGAVLKMLGRLLGEDLTLTFERIGNLPTVEADAGMLEQVLMNLLVNARDAMPQGGRITVATEAVEFDPQQVAANSNRRVGRHVCVKVADTGCGMDPATLKRIFEPFFTTKEIGQGTGLGLATVYGIVAQHRGWVETESHVGIGTTFRVYLPASAKALAAEEGGKPQAVPRGQETLLVVEDDAGVRETLVRALRVLGYRVLMATNGQEAMNLWRDQGRQIDLLLTDMVMPEGLTGLELAERLSAEKPDLKVVISSGYSATLVQMGKSSARGIVYLPKPYDMAQVGAILRHCLDAPPTSSSTPRTATSTPRQPPA